MTDAYRDAMPPAVVHEFPITGLDRTGVPVWTVRLWPDDGPGFGGVGYGPDEDAARASAWGECFEGAGIWMGLHGLPRTRGSYADLRRRHGRDGILDPRTACLPAGSPWTPETPLTWVPVTRIATGQPVLVPIELAATSTGELDPGDAPPGGWLLTPITNGLGAGFTPDQALGHGLRELLQRDGNSVTYRALDRGVGVRIDVVEDPATRALLDRLDALGIDVIVKLAGTDDGVANLYVVGCDRDLDQAPHPLSITACGEAAHPDREQALAKALREFCSSRVRKPFMHGSLTLLDDLPIPADYFERVYAAAPDDEEPRAFTAMRDWLGRSAQELAALIADPVLKVREWVRFSSLPRRSAPDVSGLDVLAFGYDAPGGAFARKVIVPGLEVETASYGRIGRRNVARLEGRGLAGFGPPPTGTARVLLPDDEPAWLDRAAIDRLTDPLYALYREPSRHAVALRSEVRAR
jgi:ribosomal protein S12 methylthiotransferase accessory factor